MISAKLSKERRDVIMKSYIKLTEKEEHAIFFLLGMGEAKFQFCLLRSMAFVWIFIVISRG
jgi:hypothetical protein